MKTAEVRKRFVDHFAARGHTVVPGVPLPFDDPNLLFVNAGMVPFVPYFIGEIEPQWNRATSVQKCVRTIDIEEVGKTTRHGTFFQMNGNFSFGDYFKEDAIKWAWELSTSSIAAGGYGLDGDRIWPTVFLDDDEAVDIWHRIIGVPLERITRRGRADNLWSMGIPGPCGPCSELFYDRGADYGKEGGPEVDEDRYMEFWNLVFMQNVRGPGSTKEDFEILGELPRKNIDTGMGLERMATLLQGVDNLYEIDETAPVLERAAQLAGKRYGANSGHAATESSRDDVLFRVIADHVRTGLMLVSDGVTPGNEGRGYVLRRILRRAIRSAKLLGITGPVLPELLPVSRDAMAPSYPEVATDYDRISMIAYGEEESFLRTLSSGTTILDQALAATKSSGGTVLGGSQAFTLHDTYGFPIDLTLEIAEEQGLSVDQDEFRRLMTEQRQRAKKDASSKKHGADVSSAYRTLSDGGPTIFTGYDTLETESRVRGIVRNDELVESAGPGETVEVVLDATSFYAESGGQSPDEGVIVVQTSSSSQSATKLRVIDVQRPVKGLIVHKVIVESGELRPGAEAVTQVDPEWRIAARQAHSGTHVIHAALREVLGPTALQRGSYNKPGYLRLDFAWPKGLDERTRSDVEEVANRALRKDLGVAVRHMPLSEARELGALALFGETYDQQDVRVVEIGGAWSRELCGGTHVSHSSQVGSLAVTGESSVGSGLRRIEAFVGLDATRFMATERALVTSLSDLVKVPPAQLRDRVEAMMERLKTLERELERSRAEQVLQQAGLIAQQATDVGGVALVAEQVSAGLSGNDLRTLALDVRQRIDGGGSGSRPAVVVLASAEDERLVYVAAVSKAGVEAGHKAGDVIKVLSQALGGRGGGKPDLAQGAGGKPADAPQAFDAVRKSLLAI